MLTDNLLLNAMKKKIELKAYPGVSLSVREAEVLLACAAGRTIQGTADELSVSYSTVKTHRENIRDRFQIKGNYGIKLFADQHRDEIKVFLDLI
jgi:DNA-binding CsgD family transcriptional regulator